MSLHHYAQQRSGSEYRSDQSMTGDIVEYRLCELLFGDRYIVGIEISSVHRSRFQPVIMVAGAHRKDPARRTAEVLRDRSLAFGPAPSRGHQRRCGYLPLAAPGSALLNSYPIGARVRHPRDVGG